MHQRRNFLKTAFTITELMIVAISVAVIAAFAVPTYQRSLDRSNEKSAARGLTVIRDGLQIYYAHNGQWVDHDMTTVDDINATLNVYLIEKNVTYSCTGTVSSYDCTATSDDGWSLRSVNTVNNGDPYCPGNDCPRCSASGCPYS